MSTRDMSFLVYFSISFLVWLTGTLGMMNWRNAKFWSWIIAHAYALNESIAVAKQTWLYTYKPA